MTKESRNNVVGSSKRVRRATDPLLAKEKIKEQEELDLDFMSKNELAPIDRVNYMNNRIEETAKEIKEGLEKIMIDKDNPNEPTRVITVEEWEEFWKEFLKEK